MNYFTTFVLIAFVALLLLHFSFTNLSTPVKHLMGFFKVEEIQAESSNAKFSTESSKTFNPFSLSSWYNLQAQFLQFWYPLFQPAYYPSFFQKPTTPATTTTVTTPGPVTQDQTEKTVENNKISNIFGVGPVDDTVPYLPPPREIEW